jgi:Mycobacterium membrane protein
MTRVFRRAWLPLLVIVAVGAGVVIVSNVRQVFGSNPVVITEKSSDNAEDFNPKFVKYEIYGTGSTAVINYMDLEGKPQRAAAVTLPWTLTLSTTLPSVQPNILAQGDGNSISCRVSVDDVVKEERTATGMNAETFCFVKAA